MVRVSPKKCPSLPETYLGHGVVFKLLLPNENTSVMGGDIFFATPCDGNMRCRSKSHKSVHKK